VSRERFASFPPVPTRRCPDQTRFGSESPGVITSWPERLAEVTLIRD
jgi:hypothetical protein